MASAYHNALSWLYSYLYDIHSSELKSLRQDYGRFKQIADTAGKKLCPLAKKALDTESLESADFEKVQVIYNGLEGSWPGFKAWWAAARQLEENVSNNISAEIQDAMTPKCDEYPTADGKYVIVKCTVPPG
jgi:hypothetical protein